MTSFNFNHFYYFYLAARMGGVTTAADYLHTSQSSLSTQIKTLENCIGRTLYRRAGRKLELTEDGQIVYEYCRRSFSVMDDLAFFLKKSQAPREDRWRVGLSSSIDKEYVTDLLALALRGNTAKPSLNLTTEGFSYLSNRLKLGEIDFLFSSADHSVDENIIPAMRIQLPMALIQRKRDSEDPVTGSVVGIKSLQPGLVLPTVGTALRKKFNTFLQMSLIDLPIVFESNDYSVILRAIKDGMGAGFVPLSYLSQEIESGEIEVMQSRPDWNHEITVYTNRWSTTSKFWMLLSSQLTKTKTEHSDHMASPAGLSRN